VETSLAARHFGSDDIPIAFQRCLMPGGACEATAFQLYEYRSAALCIALGNFHNCTPDGRIDSEFIDLRDLRRIDRRLNPNTQFQISLLRKAGQSFGEAEQFLC
jgi:hypothetical protein